MTLLRASFAAAAIAALLQSSGGAVAGMAIDATGRPLPGSTVVLFDPPAKREFVTTTDAAGVFRIDTVASGKYMVVATRPGYLSAEYGAPWPGDPGRLVEIGAAGRTDLTLTLRKGGAISGTVRDENGDPVAATVAAFNQVKSQSPPSRARTDSRGQYRIPNLLPGPYVILATAGEGPVLGSNDQRMARVAYYNGAVDETEATLVTIAGEPEVPGIDIQLRAVPVQTIATDATVYSVGLSAREVDLRYFASSPPTERSTVAGRIVFDGVSRREPMYALLLSNSGRSGGPWFIPPPLPPRYPGAPAQPIDRFSVTAPGVGAYVLQWQPQSGPWAIKAATGAGGRDILDLPVTLAANGRIDDVVVTFTDQVSEVSGFLLASDGLPLIGTMAMVFSADARYWYPGSRRIQMVLADGTGRYMLSGLPAGDYRAALFSPTHPGQRVPLSQTLTQLSAGSVSFRLGDGEQKIVDIPGRRSDIVR